MKTLFRPFALTFILVFCLLSVGGISSYAMSSGWSVVTGIDQENSYKITYGTSKIVLHQPEICVQLSGKPTTPDASYSFNFLSDINNAYKFGQLRYTSYLSLSENLLIKFKKTDLIYPFHFFW